MALTMKHRSDFWEFFECVEDKKIDTFGHRKKTLHHCSLVYANFCAEISHLFMALCKLCQAVAYITAHVYLWIHTRSRNACMVLSVASQLAST